MKRPVAFQPQLLSPPREEHIVSHNRHYYFSFFATNLALTLFSLFCFLKWDSTQLSKLNYPADTHGKSCYIDYPHSYPYLYIDLSLPSITYRCVDACPASHNFFIITDSGQNTILAPSIEETLNHQMGGVCWSQEKDSFMEKRGFHKEISSKTFLGSKFKVLTYLCVGALILGTLVPVVVFLIPFSIVLGATFLLCLGFIIWLIILTISSTIPLFRTQSIILLAFLGLFLVLSILIQKKNIYEAIIHVQQVKLFCKQGYDASLITFLKCFKTPLAMSIFHCLLLALLMLEYLALAASEKLTKQSEEMYFSIEITWWKYALLLLQWLFLSHLLEKLYQYIVTRTGYHLATNSGINCPSFSFSNVRAIYHLSLLHTLLWLPIKMVLLFKPEGAILREKDKSSLGQEVSKLCYCCCGLALNYLHKLTFNPFLVIALESDLQDLESSLALVQEAYHQQNPWLDRSSLWIYRLACYLSIGMLSALCLRVTSISPQNSSQSVFSHIFLIFAIAIAVQICHYQVTFWSRLAQVAQFVSIISKHEPGFQR